MKAAEKHSNHAATVTTVTTTTVTTTAGHFINLPGLVPDPYNLTKAQAVRYLDRRFANYLTANGLPDLIDQAPDFRTLIDENVRDEFPPSALLAGTRRGNTRKYGYISHKRVPIGKNTKLYFRKSDLDNWFDTQLLPAIAKRLH